MKPYEFSILAERRIIKETISGYWTIEIARQYKADFEKAIAPLKDNPWAKLVDLNQWKTSNPEIVAVVGEHLEWARVNKMAFSANIVAEPIPRMQLRRMFVEGGTSDFSEVFETEFPALAWLKEHGF